MTDGALFELPFDEILRRTAARISYPGGGAASAMACASAASLVAMAGRFTGEPAAEAVGCADSAMGELADLAHADADAFGELLAAWRIPRDEPDRQDRVAAAAVRASQVPLRICRIGADLVRHAAWLAQEGKPDLRGDAYAAAQLARAGVHSAARLVELNVHRASDPEIGNEAARLVVRTTVLVEEMERTARGSAGEPQ